MAYIPKASKEELEQLYFIQKKSPDEIARLYKCTGRSVRGWMYQYGLKLLGPAHLLTGKPAPWNSGPKDPYVIESMRRANIGRSPANKGKGSVIFNCEVCKIEVKDKPYRRKRTCSKKCKDQLSHIHRGEKHWNYTDGAISSKQRQRWWAKTKEWRQSVLNRNDRKCVRCRSEKRLVAHHLNGWAKHPELRFDIDNGITLCHDCHWTFHRSTSHKNATKAMFEEWMARTSPM